MPDNRGYLANLRFAKAALESASDLLQITETAENRELTAVCLSVGKKARILSKLLEQEEQILTDLD